VKLLKAKALHCPESSWSELQDSMNTNARDEEAALPANARPQRTRNSVPTVLFIIFMLFMLTSHNGDEFLARHQYQDALQTLTYQLSNYTSWMNGTTSNFTLVSRSILRYFAVSNQSANDSHCRTYLWRPCWTNSAWKAVYWILLGLLITLTSLDLYMAMQDTAISHILLLLSMKLLLGEVKPWILWPMRTPQTSQKS